MSNVSLVRLIMTADTAARQNNERSVFQCLLDSMESDE